MNEDSPPMVRPSAAPDELTEIPQRRTTLPPAEVDAKMVALALSSMATTLEAITAAVACVPELTAAVRNLENQHDVTLMRLDELRGSINLAGSMAAAAQETAGDAHRTASSFRDKLDRIEHDVGKIARSVQGLDEANKSMYPKVFPTLHGVDYDPDSSPTVETGEPIPLRRFMAGE